MAPTTIRSRTDGLAAPPRALALACAAGLACAGGAATALELGFEARALVQRSDNIGFDDAGEEDAGTLGFATVGLFGDRRSPRIDLGFSGEIDTRRRLDDEDDDWDSISRFLGAAEFRITPRALTWYVGDVLGGVLDDTLQPVDGFETRRRNVFVTGPALETPLGAFGRLDARLLYVNQSEEGDELETLYSGYAEYRRERVVGRFLGVKGSNVFTDAPQASGELDFNRTSAAALAGRERGPWALYGELGATAYATDDESVSGVAALGRVTRVLGPESLVALTLSRDLNDQTLGTVEGLIADGVGERQDADGIFVETRVALEYSSDGASVNALAGIGVADIDYELEVEGDAFSELADDQDQLQGLAYAALGRALSPTLRGELAVDYRREEFDIGPDELTSVLATARLLWRFSRSFELEGSYLVDRATGTETRADEDGVALARDVDRTENRVGIGIRWAPPTRASRDLTVELKSLIR